MSLLRFVLAYFKTQQALQWWTKKQSMYLLQESHQIRDHLLQQSFAIRRSIERDLAADTETLPQKGQVWLNQLEQFHYDLEKLSDRLVPAYIEDSLPIAIQYLIQSWQMRHPQVKFQLDILGTWRQESSYQSLVIVKFIDELLKIFLTKVLTEGLINITLKRKCSVGKLRVEINYEHSKNIDKFNNKDLGYLCETFRFLTAGQYCRTLESSKESLYFYWNNS